MMDASTWRGLPRGPLRAGPALVAAADLVALVRTVHTTVPSDLTRADAPAFLRTGAANPILLVPVVLVGLAGLLGFGRGHRVLAAGSVALACLAYLSESHAALVGGPARSFYASGAALLGWLAGAAGARSLGWEGRLANRLGEACAAAALAATYVAATLGKLLESGPAWADPQRLRGIVLAQHGVGGSSLLDAWARLVIESPTAGQALALATLVVQGGAFLYLAGPRLRLLWGSLLLAFHASVFLLTGIPYVEAAALLTLFTFPWARLAASRVDEPPPPESPHAAAVLRRAALIVAIVVGLSWVAPIRTYTTRHHQRDRAARPAYGPRSAGSSPGQTATPRAASSDTSVRADSSCQPRSRANAQGPLKSAPAPPTVLSTSTKAESTTPASSSARRARGPGSSGCTTAKVRMPA
jgi:hypothetical protein